MENNCLIPNFDGFQVTLNKSTDAIYFRIVNSVTYQCFEKSITQIDLRNGNVNNIQKAFVLYKKSFMKENHYNLVIEVKEGILSLIFKAIFDECFELSSKIDIPEIVSADEIDVSSALVRVEMKQKEDISRIMEKMLQMESLLQVMLDCEICIGTIRMDSNSNSYTQHAYNNVKIPYHIKINVQELYIDQGITNLYGEVHINTYAQHQRLKMYHIFYGKIRKLPYLKKIIYIRDTALEKECRIYNNHHGVTYTSDIDCVMPEQFDFGKFYNGILEEFSITHLNGISTLESVEKMKTLTTLEIVNADQLSNASTYIVQLPNLKKLTFKNCPKIVSDDSAKLQDYCRKKDIVLSIS